MSTTRALFRSTIGNALGRRYYLSSTTNGTSTTDALTDTRRTEFANEWDGATLLISSTEVLVRGTSQSGIVYLDTVLGSAPDSGTAYEMVKGWTISDMNEGINAAHRRFWPYGHLAVNDKGVLWTETTGTDTYALNENWKEIAEVRRQQVGTSNPVFYETLIHGLDYEIIDDTTGLVYRSLLKTTTGTKLWFIGSGYLTIGTADNATSIAPVEVITAGALAWLYQKGITPDDLEMNKKFQQESEKWMLLFEKYKRQFPMIRPIKGRIKTPQVRVINDGMWRTWY